MHGSCVRRARAVCPRGRRPFASCAQLAARQPIAAALAGAGAGGAGGEAVTVTGWVRSIRWQKKQVRSAAHSAHPCVVGGDRARAGVQAFAQIDDGSCGAGLQLVLAADKTAGFDGLRKLPGLATGAAVRATGALRASPGRGTRR